VQRQRHELLDIVCVEDGETHPNIKAICDDYGMAHIQLGPKPPSVQWRVATCRNVAMRSLHGDVIIWGTQDNVFLGNFFAHVREWWEKNGADDVMLMPYIWFLEDDAFQGEHETGVLNWPRGEIDTRAGDRQVVIGPRAQMPLYDEDFNVCGTMEGLYWAWLCHQKFRFMFEPNLQVVHIGHSAGVRDMRRQGLELLRKKTGVEIWEL